MSLLRDGRVAALLGAEVISSHGTASSSVAALAERATLRGATAVDSPA